MFKGGRVLRFLHTSDWHLGRIFYGQHLTDDQDYILQEMVRLVKDSKLDAVVIAGDVYDRAVPPIEAVELLDEVLAKFLLDCKVPVIMIAGNHDSAERLGFANRLLARQGLHVIGQVTNDIKPIVLADEFGPVYFLPLAYAEPAIVREKMLVDDVKDHEQAAKIMLQSLTAQVPPGARTVAVAHVFIAGASESDSERPLSVGGSSMVNCSLFENFNYTALGHLHNSQQAGKTNICYSGSLLKYSFSEAGQTKGLNIVDLGHDGTVEIERISLTPKRDMRCINGYFKDILYGPQAAESKDDYIFVTLKDSEAILEPLLQLRSVYPNVLHIERPQFTMSGELQKPCGDHRKMAEDILFASFFEQVTGNGLTSEQKQVFNTVLNEFYGETRRA